MLVIVAVDVGVCVLFKCSVDCMSERRQFVIFTVAIDMSDTVQVIVVYVIIAIITVIDK